MPVQPSYTPTEPSALPQAAELPHTAALPPTAALPQNAALPQAAELEKVVLGTILLEPSVLDQLASVIPGPQVFHCQAHEQLYRLIVELHQAGEPIDLYSVARRLSRSKTLAGAITPADLAGYTQKVGSGMHVMRHAALLVQTFIARELARAGMTIASAACDPGRDVDDVLALAAGSIEGIQELAAGKSPGKELKTVIETAMRQTNERCVRFNEGHSCGIATGLEDLDRLIGGWQPATLNIVAARPSMGKTALMIHLAKSAAQSGVPGCIYSLEMSDVSIANRLLLSDCPVDSEAFRAGRLGPEDWKALHAAQERLSCLPIHIDDNPVVSMRYIRSHARLMHRKGLCRWIMIDYLQLAETERVKGGTREREIAEASRQAKIIARELNIPVILLSQLNRSAELRSDKKPTLADLRESGAIEQDADTVTFIYRPAYYKIETIDSKSQGRIADSRHYGQLIVAKQRDGATGTVSFLHNEAMTRIEDYSAWRHSDLLKQRLPLPNNTVCRDKAEKEY